MSNSVLQYTGACHIHKNSNSRDLHIKFLMHFDLIHIETNCKISLFLLNSTLFLKCHFNVKIKLYLFLHQSIFLSLLGPSTLLRTSQREGGQAGPLSIFESLTCWLTRQCEGPWWMRMRTMSTSPRQAARCSGKQPLLSATFVDASNCSSFSTTSLRVRQDVWKQINTSAHHKMEE